MPLTENQERAVRTAGKPLFIQAGAGTGKTFTLTKRLGWGLDEQSGPVIEGIENLLTITFTNKAAGELLGRVRGELRARGLADAALKVDAAWISTIHAMCRNVLAAHAFEAGVDPGAELLGEEESAELLAQVVDGLFSELAGDARIVSLVDTFGSRGASTLVEHLAANVLQLAPEGAGSFELGPAPRQASAAYLGELRAVLAGMLEALHEAGAPDTPTCTKSCDKLQQAIEVLDGALEAAAVTGVTNRQAISPTAASSDDDASRRVTNRQAISPASTADLLPHPEHAASQDAAPDAAAPVPARAFGHDDAGGGSAVLDAACGHDLARQVADGQSPSVDAACTAPPAFATWAEIDALLAECLLTRGGNVKKHFKPLFLEAYEALLDAKAYAAAAAARERLEAALALAAQAEARHRAAKRSLGALDTNDLLIETYRLLVSHPDIAAEYRGRFSSVMVDEFQDTDLLQVEIVKRLCDEGLTTLATVGDAQQSIYGFRGADLEVYRQMRAEMRERGSEEVALDMNFRSHSHILAFVEDIFSKDAFFAHEFLRVKPGPANDSDRPWHADGSPRVRVLLSAGHKAREGRGRTGLDDLRAADARAVADAFEAYAAAGAAYGDMAILMSSTRKADAYLDELRSRGIPCVVSGGSTFYELPETVALADLLRVLANRDDDEALFRLLGSPLFDVADTDLLALSVLNRQGLRLRPDEMRVKPSLWDALQRLCTANAAQLAGLGLDGPGVLAQNAHRVLSAAFGELGTRPLSSTVREVVRACGWTVALRRQGPAGMAVQANVDRFCDLLDGYERMQGASVFGAAEHMRSLVEMALEGTGARGRPGSMVSEGSAAVQIMTIHASKGLEFPIVAVAEFEKAAHARASEAVQLTEDGATHLALPAGGGREVGEYLDALADEYDAFSQVSDVLSHAAYARVLARRREAEEQQRLLYVALTRARDTLLLVAHDATFASTGELGRGLFADVAGAVFGEELPGSGAVVRTEVGALVGVEVRDVPYPGDEQPQGDAGAAVGAAEDASAAGAGTARFAAGMADASVAGDADGMRVETATAVHAAEGEPMCPAGGGGSAFAGTEDASAAGAVFHYLPAERPAPRIAHRIGRARTLRSYSALARHDEDAPASSAPALADEPKAETASPVGSAFHLVAQWMAQTRTVEGPALAARTAAAARRWGLDGQQTGRLEAAVAAWSKSERLATALALPHVHAEHAFLVQAAGLPLEGYIDLLCLDGTGRKALVVDYKTGTSGEGEGLRERYRLQAVCYAYAVLSTGLAQQVELVFVRPEAGMEEVAFEFDATQTAELEREMFLFTGAPPVQVPRPAHAG